MTEEPPHRVRRPSTRPAGRCARARPHPGAQRTALHPDAVRPGRRRDQGRAARGRPHPVRPTRAVNSFCHATSCSRTPASATSASTWRTPRAVELLLRTGRRLRRRGRELPPRGDGPHGPRLRRAVAAQPADRARLASPATARPARGCTDAPTRRWWRPRRAAPGADRGARPGAALRNDPFSHADVYTALECAAGDPAPRCTSASAPAGPVDRRLDGRDDAVRQRARAVTSCATTPTTPAASIRSFGPGDYLVLTAADGDDGDRSAATRPSKAPSTRSAPSLGRRRPARRPALRRPSPLRRATPRPIYRRDRRLGRARMTDRRRASKRRSASTAWPSGALRTVREVADTDWAAERGAVVDVPDRGGGTVRIPNSPWHFSAADVGRPRRAALPRRGQPHRARRGARPGRRHELDALEAEGVLSRAGRARAGADAPTAEPWRAFPVEPMKAAIGVAAARPTTPSWAYEIKWDGYRTLVFVDVTATCARAEQQRLDVTATLPRAGRHLAPTCNAPHGGARRRDRGARRRGPAQLRAAAAARAQVTFHAFDVLAIERPRHHRAAVRAAPRAARRGAGTRRRTGPCRRIVSATARRCWRPRRSGVWRV